MLPMHLLSGLTRQLTMDGRKFDMSRVDIPMGCSFSVYYAVQYRILAAYFTKYLKENWKAKIPCIFILYTKRIQRRTVSPIQPLVASSIRYSVSLATGSAVWPSASSPRRRRSIESGAATQRAARSG